MQTLVTPNATATRPVVAEPSLLGNRRAVVWYAIGIALGIAFAALILPSLTGPFAGLLAIVIVVALAYDAGRMLQAVRVRGQRDYPLVPRSRVERVDDAAWAVAEPGLSVADGLLEMADDAKDLFARAILFVTQDAREARAARLLRELREPLMDHLPPGEEVLAVSQAGIRGPFWIDMWTHWVVVTPQRVLCFKWRRGGRLGPLRDQVARDGLTIHEWFRGFGTDAFSWVLVLRSPDDSRLRLRFTMYWRPQALDVVRALAHTEPARRPEPLVAGRR